MQYHSKATHFGIRILIISLFLSGWKIIDAQITQWESDPLEAKIVYEDVERFISAWAMLQPGVDSIHILQTQYIDLGSPGLEIFIEKYDLNARGLVKAIQKHPEDYGHIHEKLTWLKTQESLFRNYFAKSTRFLPEVIFPPTYFLVDMWRGIGSGSIEGQLITIEKEASNVTDPGIHTHIIHELIHLNQLQAIGSLAKYLAIYNEDKSLLAITIREGIAEFFAELITGKYTQDHAREYLLQNEQELWSRFSTSMLEAETLDWMWKTPLKKEQPRDLAYVLGARIVEYYYKRSVDLDDVVSDILSVTEYPQFLDRTGYPDKFK